MRMHYPLQRYFGKTASGKLMSLEFLFGFYKTSLNLKEEYNVDAEHVFLAPLKQLPMPSLELNPC